MSSLSNIPRVATQKISQMIFPSDPLTAERMEYERVQAMAIAKAINAETIPPKEKHVRTLIIGTYTEKSAHTFWVTAQSKLPVLGNPLVAWKFCYVLHKILRDGHPSSLKESGRHREFLLDAGRLWSHLKVGFGPLITSYCGLLVTKLTFHQKNPKFQGNLQISNEELVRIAENDVGAYFELSVEMLDYMEKILEMTGAIFGSFDMSRANSMTQEGQCKLVAVIPCILDSCQLYDFIVKMLFRLHSALPQDTLTGHRDRFYKQFKQLQHLYHACGNLQFFKNLIQIPSLPDRAPDFFSSQGITQHVTPVAAVQPEPEQQDFGLLVETDSFNNGPVENIINVKSSPPQAHNGSNGFRDTFTNGVQAERDRVIDELLQEIDRLQRAADKIKSDDLMIIEDLRNRIVELEAELEEQRTKAEAEREELAKKLEQPSIPPQVAANIEELHKKLTASEEKRKQLKKLYDDLTQTHVALIRSNAESQKLLKSAQKVKEQLEREKNTLTEQIERFDEDKQQLMKSLEGSSTETQQQLQEQIHACHELSRKIAALEDQLHLESQNKEQSENSIKELTERITNLQDALSNAESDIENLNFQNTLKEKTLRRSYLNAVCSAAETGIRQAVNLWEHQAFGTITSTPEFLVACIDPASEHVKKLRMQLNNSNEVSSELISELQLSMHHVSIVLLECVATSHMAPIDLTDEFLLLAKQLSSHSLDFVSGLRDGASQTTHSIEQIELNLEVLQQLAGALTPKFEDVKTEDVAVMVENELHEMDKAIEAAALKIEEMLVNSRIKDSGVKLEVNAKILDSCTTLMTAIRVLVRKSRALQQEIVAAGKGFASPKEFYQKNHRWTEGLISAAKTVGLGANVLLEAADKVVGGKGKFEELVVASQEISAGTVQLVVSSKVKADKNSQTLAELSKASKAVTEAAGTVVASAKDCAQLVEEKADLDFSNMSLHKIKKIEMESQVRVLELETLLTREREKLSSIRRQHYSLAGTSEGWDEEDIARLDVAQV